MAKLVNVTDLHLVEISNFFDDQHIVQFTRSLPKLEVGTIRGMNSLTPVVLPHGHVMDFRNKLVNVTNLRLVEISNFFPRPAHRAARLKSAEARKLVDLRD